MTHFGNGGAMATEIHQPEFTAKYQQERFADIDRYCEMMQGLVDGDIIQVDRGPVSIDTALIGLDDVAVFKFGTDKAVFERMGIPRGVHFIFSHPSNAGPCVFCGIEIPADSFGIFHAGFEYSSYGPSGYEFVEVSIPAELLPPRFFTFFRSNELHSPERVIHSVRRYGASAFRDALFGLFDQPGMLQNLAKDKHGAFYLREWVVDGVNELTQAVMAEELRRDGLKPNVRFDLFRTALEAVDRSINEPLSTRSLAAEIGVSPRVLQYTFKTILRASPTQYILHRKLHSIHSHLNRGLPDSERNLTDIAMRYGLLHPGRFSLHYKTVFGQSPSVTLRQVR